MSLKYPINPISEFVYGGYLFALGCSCSARQACDAALASLAGWDEAGNALRRLAEFVVMREI